MNTRSFNVRTLILTATLFGAMLGGCSWSSEPEPDVDMQGHWRLHSVTRDEVTTVLAGDYATYLVILGNTGQANSGCDSREVRTRVDGDRVSITVGQQDYYFGCGATDVRDYLDGEYATYLREVETIQRDGDELLLTGPDVTLAYTEIPRGNRSDSLH